MVKRKKIVIFTEEQIKKLCENESFNYLSDLSTKPDLGDVFATEVSTDGASEYGYTTPTTTDDRSHTMANDWRGNAKLYGLGTIGVCEISKGEWERKNFCTEESEHGNARLKGRTFGAVNGENGKSYTATKMALSRKKRAEEKLHNGTPEEKAKASKTLSRMHQNWGGLDAADTQYSTAKISDGLIQGSTNAPKIKSAPKNSGNGKAHTPKGGVFLN